MDEATRDTLLDAALMHVMFDGWSDTAFDAACADASVDPALAKAAFPHKGFDLAVAFHKRGDRKMEEAMRAANLGAMRYSERVAAAVRFRLEAVEADKEAVRRGATLFALPQNATTGASLIWGTADAIWNTLGDSSKDYNWYTKRATLAGVYSSTVLFWLGDESEGREASWAFLDRRIENVMQFEKMKAQLRDNPVASKVFAGPNWLLSKLRAPEAPSSDLPGRWTGR